MDNNILNKANQSKVGDLQIGQIAWIVLNYKDERILNRPCVEKVLVSSKIEVNTKVVAFSDGCAYYISNEKPLNRLSEDLLELRDKTLNGEGYWLSLFFVGVTTHKELAELFLLQLIKFRRLKLNRSIETYILKSNNNKLGILKDVNGRLSIKFMNLFSLAPSYTSVPLARNVHDLNAVIDTFKSLHDGKIFEINKFCLAPNIDIESTNNYYNGALIAELKVRHTEIQAKQLEELKKLRETPSDEITDDRNLVSAYHTQRTA